MRIGEALCHNGELSGPQLTQALLQQEKTGSRLGDILIAEGFVGYRALYRALAKSKRLPFVDLLAAPPDYDLLSAADAETYLRLGALPWRRMENGRVQVAVCNISDQTLRWVRGQHGDDVDLAITSPFDIRRTVETCFGAILEQKSRFSLWDRNPEASARITLPHRNRPSFAAFGALVLLSIVWAPVHALYVFFVLCHIVYAATMIFKGLAFALGARRREEKPRAIIPDRDLPVYTVLIPMYREAESLPGLLDAMHNLDYPASKLDIKLVLEADDAETLAAATHLKPRYHFDILRVPPGNPRTKPRACNYALRFACGELVTVFDADDRPDPSQLRKAAHAFRALPPNVVCLQGRLDYYNAGDNLLTRFFALEYNMLFRHMLYGLERLKIPIPLGGTSNHIALSRLKALGEWDPFNVTEDADLGVRLAAAGLETRMLDSDTHEEAPNRTWPWIKQRSRWIKGYMQTWLVHMRKPGQLYRTLGLKGFIGFQCCIGLSCFAFLTAPVVWFFSLFLLAHFAGWGGPAIPLWLIWLTGINLALNLLTHWYAAAYCALRHPRDRRAMLTAAALYPFYLVLHTIASYRALWQLVVNPHFWDKTTHGMARNKPLTAAHYLARKAPHSIRKPLL